MTGQKKSFIPDDSETIIQMEIERLKTFKDHPFKVQDDSDMKLLKESIEKYGILNPLIVRPLKEGVYEIVSGHRRRFAAEKLGYRKVPVIIRVMRDEESIIAMVDANLQRERISFSEKAFAYKMKLEAMNRQGQRTDLTSAQVGRKLETAEIIGEQSGESRNQVRRYIRLTNLIPSILQMVDEGKIALTPAVELSYLTETEQADLLETMESEDCTPSLSQAQQLKALSQRGELTMDDIFTLLCQPKANQKEKVSFFRDDIRSFFPPHYSTARMQSTIVELLKGYQRSWQRRDRDER